MANAGIGSGIEGPSVFAKGPHVKNLPVMSVMERYASGVSVYDEGGLPREAHSEQMLPRSGDLSLNENEGGTLSYTSTHIDLAAYACRLIRTSNGRYCLSQCRESIRLGTAFLHGTRGSHLICLCVDLSGF